MEFPLIRNSHWSSKWDLLDGGHENQWKLNSRQWYGWETKEYLDSFNANLCCCSLVISRGVKHHEEEWRAACWDRWCENQSGLARYSACRWDSEGQKSFWVWRNFQMDFIHIPLSMIWMLKQLVTCFKKMTKRKAIQFFFLKWKEQAAIMAMQGSVKVNEENIQVDTQPLFQQLIIAAKTNLKHLIFVRPKSHYWLTQFGLRRNQPLFHKQHNLL